MKNILNNDIPCLPMMIEQPYRFSKHPIKINNEIKNLNHFHLQNKLNNMINTNQIDNEYNNQMISGQGTHLTKFHKGFNRRSITTIKDTIKDYKIHSPLHIESKIKVNFNNHLLRNISSSEYNIISGEKNKTSLTLVNNHEHHNHISQRAHCNINKSKFLKNEEEMQMRNSNDRFFKLWKEDPNRIHIQQREGLLKDKKSSILGTGNNDLKSYGVSDALNNSTYYFVPEKVIKI